MFKLRTNLGRYDIGSLYRRITSQLTQYALLVRLNRPIGIYLLLWPTLWALWIAGEGNPDLWILFVFVTGVILMRSAGCAINDFADRNIDTMVERTRYRPLACGKVSSGEAIALFMLLSLLAFLLVLTLNGMTILLSLGGVALAFSYPFMKRFHYLPQVHLGAAFGWAIPMAFAAQTGEFPTSVAWLLFIATVLWTTAYDTMYAMADRKDDLKIGVKSTAILFGKADRLMIGALQVLLMFDLLLVAQQARLGIYFYLGLTAAAGLAIYQQKLIANREPDNCFKAFLNNNYFGMLIFIGLVLEYLT
ncbi:MAG: 4-hydroxybenzoate octaprenyltransferase [Gammaproteobacteria bacterium]|nr:4-hydroxybenzoate octaprenyltransferase [Gammaproteobacteria bacterium]